MKRTPPHNIQAGKLCCNASLFRMTPKAMRTLNRPGFVGGRILREDAAHRGYKILLGTSVVSGAQGESESPVNHAN